jgi:ribonuclease-3
VLTEALFELLPGEPEGVLSKSRSSLSKGVFLCQLARQLDLGACLRLSTSEEQTGGRNRASALEDAFESLMGALYLDSNLETARRIILALYGPLTPRLATIQPSENPKGRLQELVQPLHGNHALRYEVIAIHGEDHAREYEVQLFLNDQPLGIGRGTSKKSAEEQAARLGLEKLDTAAPG